MRRSKHIPRQLFTLTITLVGLLSWHILPIPHSELAVQAANRTKFAKPTGQPVSRVVNGRIAFVSSDVNGKHSDIYTMNPDGSDRKQLTFSQEQEYEQPPAWSPDGTKIAFARYISPGNGGQGYSEILVMNGDGSDQRRLTTHSKLDGGDGTPAWSPDGTKIAFYRIDSVSMPSAAGIFVMNGDGSDQRRLTQSKFDYSPTWSPDGTKIAFYHSDGIGSAIFVMNADGSDQRAVASNSKFFGRPPAWSPDGLKFAVADSGALNTYGIYLINVDGSNRTQITDSFEDGDPAWSPDGSKMTFLRCADDDDFGCSDFEIWVVNADGSHPTKLTDTKGYTHVWSPDGTKIIVDSAQSSGADLLVMNPDGSGLTNITNRPDRLEYSPSWQPLSLPPVVNPIDDPQFFVSQHYRDFLNRQADDLGLAFWTNEITSCGADPQCIEYKRINVSAAFYLSIEFQRTGYLVERVYKAAYGDATGTSTFGGTHQIPVPIIRLNEFLPDTQEIGNGVIVNQPGWEQVLENNKQAFLTEFVQRNRFTTAYPQSMTAGQFVDKLNDNAGNVLSVAERDQLVNELTALTKTPAQVLRAVAEDADLNTIEFNRAFVLMQYFGYLRRNPNDAPDSDYTGFDFWLGKLNQFNGNINAEMVKAFIVSGEYRGRFGP
jgi:Tol biopolymer transport system component